MFLLENDNNDITFNESSLLEIALDSETSFNNIIVESIQMEYNAYKNKDRELLKEAKENIFVRFFNWVKEKAKAIANWFMGFFRKEKEVSESVKDFIKRAEKEISSGKYDNVSIETDYIQWDYFVLHTMIGKLQKMKALANNIDNDRCLNNEDFLKYASTKNLDEIVNKAREEIKNYKMDVEDAKFNIKVLIMSKKYNKLLKNAEKEFTTTMNDLQKSTKKIIDDPHTDTLKDRFYRKRMTDIKDTIQAGTRIISAFTNLKLKMEQNSISAIKLFLKKGKSQTKGKSNKAKGNKIKESYDFDIYNDYNLFYNGSFEFM